MSIEDDEAQLRAIYARWFEATAAKDIDGVMANIAGDAVSYEHDTPLQYVGVDAVRAVCQHGFDLADGEITWDVPDLQIVIEGTWP